MSKAKGSRLKAEVVQEIRRSVVKVKRDVRRVSAFFAAYDAWAHSPDGTGGDRFDAMVEARGEIEDLFPSADEEEEE